MTLLRVAGGHLVTEAEFQRNEPAITNFMIGNDKKLAFNDLSLDENLFTLFNGAIDARGDWKPTPIVDGGPLSIQIRHVYTGKYPKDPLGLRKRAPMLLTSALKNYAVYAPSSRAVNFLTQSIPAKTNLQEPKATEQGTPIVAYYPAVVTDSVTLTIDMAFDSFPDELFKGIGNAFKSLAALPIFLPYAGYLMAAGSLVKLTGDVADKLIDQRPKFSQSESINFNLANGPVSSANLLVLCNMTFARDKYIYDWDKGIVDIKTGQPYDGDEPYVVLLIDGAARPNLKDFAPTAASAAMIERFLGGKEGSEVAIEGFLNAMKLWNDYQYRMEADKLEKQLADTSLTAEAKAALTKKFNSIVANIQSDELKLPKKA